MTGVATERRAALDAARTAVGEGIHAFGLVEWQMTLLYAAIMKLASNRLCFLTFEGARHFETKRRILLLVAKEKLSDGQMPKFSNLINRIGRKVEFRDKLAHWQIAEWIDLKKSLKGEAATIKPALQPPFHSSRFKPTHLGDERPIFVGEMQTFITGCRQLVVDMRGFIASLGA